MYYILMFLAFAGWTRVDYDGSGRKAYRDTATVTAGNSDSTSWFELSYSTDQSITFYGDTLTSDTLNFIVYYRTAPVSPYQDTLLSTSKINWTVVDTVIGTHSYYPADITYPLFLDVSGAIQFKVKAITGLKVWLYFREE